MHDAGVQDNRIQTLSGYRRTADYGRLSDITVDSAAGTLTVQILTYTFSKLANSREIRIDFLGDESHSAPPSVTAGWKLHIGSYTYALDSNAHNVSRQYSSYNWDAAGPIWTEGQKITVSLTRPPELHSAEVDGTSLVVTFDQHLAAASSLANGAFEVKKRPSGAASRR